MMQGGGGGGYPPHGGDRGGYGGHGGPVRLYIVVIYMDMCLCIHVYT